MAEVSPEAEAAIASMTDAEYSAFTAKVRAPDGTVALRTAASQLLSGPALDAFVNVADVSKFAGQDGQVDTRKVLTYLRSTHGNALIDGAVTGGQGQQLNQGQGGPAGAAPGLQPGDGGRLASAKRHGTPISQELAAATSQWPSARGSAGKAAADKRFPQKGDTQ